MRLHPSGCKKAGFTWLMWRREQSVKTRQITRARCSWRIKRKAAGTSGFTEVVFFFLSLWDVPGCLSNMHHLSDSKTLPETWFPRCVTHNISCSNSFIRLHSSFQTERNSLWPYLKFLLNASRPDHCCTCLTHSFTSFIIFISKPYVTILPWNENFSITFNGSVTFGGRSYWLEKKE